MAEKLGKIEKPDSNKFKGKKKLYLVPLLLSWEDAPEEYMAKFNLYWQQTSEQLVHLESRIGKINHIYHESITTAGEDGLKELEKLSPASYRVISQKCKEGAQLETAEDGDLADESLDWQRILLMGFVSQKVAKIVTDSFLEVTRKRYQHIAQRITETLKDDEAAILFIREGHMVQFPEDLEVFSVSPPALDDIHRWLRDRSRVERKKEEAQPEKGAKKETERKKGKKDKS